MQEVASRACKTKQDNLDFCWDSWNQQILESSILIIIRNLLVRIFNGSGNRSKHIKKHFTTTLESDCLMNPQLTSLPFFPVLYRDFKHSFSDRSHGWKYVEASNCFALDPWTGEATDLVGLVGSSWDTNAMSVFFLSFWTDLFLQNHIFLTIMYRSPFPMAMLKCNQEAQRRVLWCFKHVFCFILFQCVLSCWIHPHFPVDPLTKSC